MFRLVLNDIKMFIKDKTVLFWAFVFPILLTLLLGTALKDLFPSAENANNLFDGIKIEYTSKVSPDITEGFDSFLSSMEKELGIEYEKTTDIDKSLEHIKNGGTTILVKIESENNYEVIKDTGVKGDIAETLIEIYVEKYNLMNTVMSNGSPEFMDEVMASFNESYSYTEFVGLNKEKRAVSSMDYYGIANVFAMLFWMMTSILPVLNAERNAGVLDRVKLAGISNKSYILSKFISMFMFFGAQGLLLLIFSVTILKSYIGNNVMGIVVLLITTALVASSISTLVFASFSKLDKGIGLINSIVPVIVFLGGGIIPILSFASNDGLNSIAKYTPLFVQNKAAFSLINGGNTSVLLNAFIYNFALSIIFVVASTIIFNKKENI